MLHPGVQGQRSPSTRSEAGVWSRRYPASRSRAYLTLTTLQAPTLPVGGGGVCSPDTGAPLPHLTRSQDLAPPHQPNH